jgi:hypothetical protein
VTAPRRLSGGELSAEEIVVAYHERTKHHLHPFAAGPGYLEWATQPDPFRRYRGADLVRLPLPKPGRLLLTGSSTEPANDNETLRRRVY